jgi:L-ascorbate metabolism protein UlaG (beta-lactamase superfamily)
MTIPRLVGATLALVFALAIQTAHAAGSRCLAVADAAPGLFHYAGFVPTAVDAGQVGITYVGHSTFRIESPGGITVATDYAGFAGNGPLPDVVTMNHAHSSHYTNYPDTGIKHVLRGWNPAGGPADHNVTIGDIQIRNVSTDIRRWEGMVEKDGNSIFIFETANLCIGHLGHLHHELTPQHLGWIGQLDIVFVPVDGSYTMRQVNMIEVLKLLKARLVIPMHFFGPRSLNAFVAKLEDGFEVEMGTVSSIVLSENTMPEVPKLLVLPPAHGGLSFGDP